MKFRASLKIAQSSFPQHFYLVHFITANSCAGIESGQARGAATNWLEICGLFLDPIVLTCIFRCRLPSSTLAASFLRCSYTSGSMQVDTLIKSLALNKRGLWKLCGAKKLFSVILQYSLEKLWTYLSYLTLRRSSSCWKLLRQSYNKNLHLKQYLEFFCLTLFKNN